MNNTKQVLPQSLLIKALAICLFCGEADTTFECFGSSCTWRSDKFCTFHLCAADRKRHPEFDRATSMGMQVGVGQNVECAGANQAPHSQADSQSGHGAAGPRETAELNTKDISEEIMNFSLREISASFSPSESCFFCLREVCLSGNCILPHAREMFPLSPP